MLLAAMVAMVLAAAAPALAQAVAADGGDDVQYNAVCQNILGNVGDITNTQGGAAKAVANNDSAAAAEVAQKQGVSIQQVNQCLNAAPASAAPVQQYAGAAQQYDVASPTATASPTASATAAAGGELPPTGGTSLLALGAGALLVAGGLLARRIVR
jgi:hypothetical protein